MNERENINRIQAILPKNDFIATDGAMNYRYVQVPYEKNNSKLLVT